MLEFKFRCIVVRTTGSRARSRSGSLLAVPLRANRSCLGYTETLAVLFQNCARSLSALCARFVAARAQSSSSVFPRFFLAAAFTAGRALLPPSSAQRTCRSCGAFDGAMLSSSTSPGFSFGGFRGCRLFDCPGRHSTRSRVSLAPCTVNRTPFLLASDQKIKYL